MDIHALSLSEVVRRSKSGELRCVDVAQAMLERIERLDGEFGAYATVLGDLALQQAQALDERRKAGAPLGVLHGAPVALKDLLYTRDAPTTCGTAVLADWRPDEDGTVVRRLREAGAIALGKVKLTEGAFAEHHPSVTPPKNPWHAERWVGASSSGSGVAVAAGLAHAAIGTDTGGSIRFPSAACGLVGVKPTYGRVSRHGVFPLAESLDHVGPMARCVEDAARMLQAMAGFDPRDSTTLDAPVPTYAALLDTSLNGVQVGVDWRYVGEDAGAEAVAVVQDALELLRDLGATVVEVQMPPWEALADGWMTTCGVECAAAHAATYPSRKQEYGGALASLIETGLAASAQDYARLEDERDRFRAGLHALLEDVAVLIAPCMPGPIPAAERSDAPRQESRTERFIRFTAPFDYSGHPSVTLPLDVDRNNVPRAFQLVGGQLQEAPLLAIAHCFEKAAGFRYPHLDAI